MGMNRFLCQVDQMDDIVRNGRMKIGKVERKGNRVRGIKRSLTSNPHRTRRCYLIHMKGWIHEMAIESIEGYENCGMNILGRCWRTNAF